MLSVPELKNWLKVAELLEDLADFKFFLPGLTVFEDVTLVLIVLLPFEFGLLEELTDFIVD